MLDDAADEATCDADVKRAVGSTGEDVDAVRLRGHGRPSIRFAARWILGTRLRMTAGLSREVA